MHAQGILGFTVLDADRHIVHQRKQSFAGVDESDSIVLDTIEFIRFDTNSADGFHGLINVKLDGVEQLFHCIDCIPSSPSTKLSRLYLDTDMNGPQDLPGAANCQNTCTFKRGKIKFAIQKVFLRVLISDH